MASFTGAAIWQYENMRAHAVSMMQHPVGWIQERMFQNKKQVSLL